MLGSRGLGGDKLAGVRVDVVEVVVVVVVVVVGVVRRHLLDAGGDAPQRLHVRLRGRPAPGPRLRGRTCRARPGGKGWGGNCLGGLVWVWVGLAWARYFALSLPTAAAAAAAGEAPVARAGPLPCFRGVLGVAAWPAEAVARPAGAVVATPHAASSLSSAAVAAAQGARGPCGARPLLSRHAGGRGVAGRGGGAARRGRGRNPSRALLALLCCCGGCRRGARGPCGVRPSLSRRAGARGVAG